ncbi:hypothetical protein OHA18_42150 [Kribbella sp. NBC_00709]|uniref:hypothetical protein n=1 Tax=Kribbella sp. NBC_00709 TaxID=2975972 RepID=UPI002E2A2050|nr:hypothetical protein [Kribbella sp. NBC_00709]
MTRLDEIADTDNWFDVAVLVENELSGTSARRMTEMYQVKSTPLRYHLVRPLGDASARADGSREEAERLMQKSVERMEALQAPVTGVVSDQEPVGALLEVAARTNSEEVVVVTGRHRLASLLGRDLASQLRSQVDLPLVHLVER